MGAVSLSRRAFTLIEMLICLALFGVLVGSIAYLFGQGGRTTSQLSSQLALQQGSRKAVVRLLRGLQESMEVLTPTPGCTLSYSVVRDKVALIGWYYQVAQDGAPGSFELWRYTKDPRQPSGGKNELLLNNVRRLTFTSRSEGSLLINLTLADSGREYGILTCVRLRNLPSAEELW